MTAPASLHATCIVLGEAGILIRGPSGSGKSRLARALLHHAGLAGRFARLVSDDRTWVGAAHGRLVARGPAVTAGLIETRGLGLVRIAHEPAAVLRLVVDCVPSQERLPEEGDQAVEIGGLVLPRITYRIADDPLGVVLAALGDFGNTRVTT
jgi:HPr kinase/phosphorylase